MANFSLGEMYKIGREKFAEKHFAFTTRAVGMPKLLKLECDYMRFHSPFGQAESPPR